MNRLGVSIYVTSLRYNLINALCFIFQCELVLQQRLSIKQNNLTRFMYNIDHLHLYGVIVCAVNHLTVCQSTSFYSTANIKALGGSLGALSVNKLSHIPKLQPISAVYENQ